MRRCSSKPEDQEHQGRKRVLGVASVVKSACSGIVGDGVLKMLSPMHDDGSASVVCNDFCLLRFAESLYSKHEHDPAKHDYTPKSLSAWKIPNDNAQNVSSPNLRGCYKTSKCHACD